MNGIWTKKEFEQHQSSPKLAAWLASYLPKETPVIDFGCGNGYYMGYLERQGFQAIGLDGNDNADILCSNFHKADLSAPFDLGVKGAVLSLETLEHMPKQYEDVAVNNLISHCENILVVSWASVGQPGIGHINCQNKEYVIDLFTSKGFTLNEESTADARKNIDKNCDWFERNLLIFNKND